MNIKRILKFYLILTVTLGGFATLSYSDSLKNYYSTISATVFNAFGELSDGGENFFETKPYAAVYSLETFKQERESNLVRLNRNPRVANFSTNQDPEKRFVEPGTKGAEIMSLDFKTTDEALEFQSVKFKIVDTDEWNIKRAYLFNNDKLITRVSPSDGYIKFDDVDYSLDPNSEGRLSVRLDVSSSLQTHDRLRLDIENPDDIVITVGGEDFYVDDYYPIRGEYLSIAKPRVWGPHWGKEPEKK